MERRRAFTLIELLVVISIIALLMSMLMPALKRVRDQAKAVVCLANLKQWGIAINMYAEDNKGYLWEWGSWEEQWKPYYIDDKLLLCPTATRIIDEGARPPFHANTEEGTRMSYAPNYWTPTLAPDDYDGANNQVKAMLWQTAEHKGNTRIPLFGDAGNHGAMPMLEDEPPEYDGQFHPSNSGGGGNELWRFCMNRHNGYTNMLFLDYSVRKVGLKGLWKLWWGKPWRDDPPPEPDWPEWMQGLSDDY